MSVYGNYGNAYPGGFPIGYPSPYSGYPMNGNPMPPQPAPAQQPQVNQQINQQPAQQNFTPQFQQPQQPQNWQQQHQPIFPQGIPWMSKTDAEAYEPPSGAATMLWIQGENLIYLKSLDNLGRTHTQVLRYEEIPLSNVNIPAQQENTQHAAYALQSDLDAMQAKFNALQEKIQPVITMIEKQSEAQRKDPANA